MATKDTDDRPVVEQLPAGGETVNKDISRHRRKIIKASAAVVPAIMTIRSGAAAAASAMCVNQTTNVEIDAVWGDGIWDPPNDEWARMDAKPGKIITYTAGNSSNQSTLYAIRKNNSAEDWNNVLGWEFYDEIALIGDSPNDNNFRTAWPGIEFYCVPAVAPTSCISEGGGGTIFLPPVVNTAIKASNTIVKLLVYYNPDTEKITYYPMPKGLDDSPLTGSCMVSIMP